MLLGARGSRADRFIGSTIGCFGLGIVRSMTKLIDNPSTLKLIVYSELLADRISDSIYDFDSDLGLDNFLCCGQSAEVLSKELLCFQLHISVEIPDELPLKFRA